MLLVLLIGLSCAVATDTSKDISELEVKKQDIDTNINALKESNVDKTVNQKEIIGKTQNTQIDKIKAKETTKNTITKKEPTISSTEKSTKTTDDDTQEASNHDAKSNKKINTDSSTLVPLEDHEEVSYDKNTVSNEVNINPKVTNNIKDSTFNLKNIEEPYKNVSSLNQINTNGTFNLTSDTSGQLTLSDGNTTIYGNNHKIIPNNANQYFVTINAGQKLTLKNIVIDSNPGFFNDWLYRPAIIVNAGGELILDNCTISRTIQAIKSEGNVTILNSNINNNGRIAHGATIEIKGNSNVYIEKSRLSNNQYCGINVASNQAKVLLNQTELSGSIEMHVYLGNISLYNVTYDGTQITDENKVSNDGIQDTQDKTNKKNIIILEDSMISIDHAQKILNSTTMTINGRLTSGNTYLPNQTLKVYVDDVLIGEVTTNDNGYYTISYTAEEVGNHNIKVTYDGNYKYLPSEAKSSFEVYKIDTNIIINNINDELFDKLANITGTLTNANDEVISDAKVIVTINGNQKILITNSTGGFTYTGAKVLLGDNTVTALFEGTRTYNPSEDTKTFTGKKHDTQITLNPIENTHIDDSIEISGILTDVNGTVLTNKNIIITIDNQQHTITTDDNGKYRITHTITSSGEKTVLVTYDGDTAYNPSSNQTSFNVRKINTTISLDNISDTTIDSTIWISGILKDEIGNILPNTQVSILINTHNITTTTDVNGKYNYSYTTTTLGENRIMVGYIGNDKYSSSYNETSFNVHRINTNLSIDTIDDTTIGSDITISGILKDEFGNLLANKEIIITIDGQEYTVITDNDGKYNYIYTTITLGENIVNVNYPGDNKYSPSSNQTSFNVRRINTNLSIDTIDDTTIESDITISGILKDEFGNLLANKEIIITINGQEYTTTTDNDGKYNYTYMVNTLDQNTVIVNYLGDNKYSSSSNQTSFNVRRINTNLSIDTIDDTTIESDITISGILKDEFGNLLANKEIIITINGQEYTTTTDNDGKYNYKYTTEMTGLHNIEVIYAGDTTYFPSNNKTTFNVRKINTNISINNINDTTIGQEIEISGVLTDEFGNTLPNTSIVIIINGQEYTTTTDNNGKYNYKYTTSTLGENIVSVNYPGDNKYSPSSNQTSFNVRRINTNLSIDTIDDTTIGSDITISGILKDEFGNLLANKEIIITINGQEYTIITDNDGKYNYIYTTSTLGENIVSVNYLGDNKYSPSSNQTSFNVRRINTNLSIDTIDDTTIGSDITISGILKDEFGNLLANKEIIITINGQEYTIITDNDGKYNYIYTTSTLGENIVSVNYPGNNKYSPSSNQTSFNVRKINTNLSIDTIDDTTIESDITISGILKDEFGNLLANKEIIITINGQEYTTTTDNDGKYNYKYTTEMTGLHNIEVIYAGDTTYFPSNNKTTFNVRKINTNISINNINDTTIGQEIEISGVLTDEFGNNIPNATIKIIVNGNQQNTTITDAEGNYKVIIKNTLGLNTVFVIYDGNYKYYPSNNQTSFNTTTNTMISINNIDDTTIGSIINIDGTLKDGEGNTLSNTNLIITINGQEYTVITDNDGKYNYIYTTSTLGENIVEVAFTGNATHKPSNNQTSFNVRKINTNLSINDIDNTTIGKDITISGVLTDEFRNKLINTSIVIIINGQEYTTTTDDDGKYNYIYTTSTLGENIVNVNYPGDNKYSPSSNQTSFNVRKINTNLSIDTIDDTTIESDITISGVLTDEFGNLLANKEIIITINGQEYTTTTDNDGKYNYTYMVNTLDQNTVIVNYLGDNKYSSSNNQTSFNVRKINTNLSINDVNDTTIGQEIEISGVLTDEFGNNIPNATIKIIVNGNQQNTTITDAEGNYKVIIKNTLGLNTVFVIYDGNYKYYPSNNQTSFNTTTNTMISINNIDDTTIGSIINIDGTLKDGEGNTLSNTNLIITINGQKYTVITDNDGKYNYIYTTITLGENIVEVAFTGNTTHKSSNNQTSFNVRKINTNLSIDIIDDTTIGSDITISGVLTDEFGNTLSNTSIVIIINGQEYTTTTDNDGKYNYIYTTITLGENIVSVNYPGDNKYSPSSNQTSFNVRKINTNLSINDVNDTTIGQEIEISGVLTDEFGNTLSNTSIVIIINGQEYTTTTDNDGKYNYIYTTITLGENIVSVNYPGNNKYSSSSNQTSFNVRKINTNLSIDIIDDTTIESDITISGVLTDEFGNTLLNTSIVIIINGQEYTTTTDNDGKYNYIYTTSTLDENIVNVNYLGNNKYSPSSNQTSFNVRKINTNLSIDTIDDTTVGRDITVSGVLTDEFGNILANTNITIIVNGNIFKATTDVNGVYNYGYTIDVTGLHRVDVIYSGNTTHFPSNNNTSFNVRKIDTNLSINTINDTTISSNVEVSGTLTDEYENILPNTTITININGQEYTTTTDNNGKYNYTYMVNTLDQNTVIVNYPGDDKYNSATTFTTFNVRKINTKLFINTINDTIVGQDINVGGVLKDEFENILVNTTVEITITNPKGTKNTYTTTTNEEGMYSVTYAGNIDGTYKVEVNYIGNNTYNSSSNETSFNTRKINTKLIIDSIENTTIDTNIFITGKLVDEFGNIVPNTFINITVNNNMIELYVDANGTFTCIYKTSILGENNITLQYNGNDTYNPSSNEASFNVRKLKSTIVVDSIVGYIGENITLTARIIDENGKLVNGGNIVFKFNGKTLREDGRFDSTASPMKFKVVDGIVKYITVADAYLRNVKHITATYSGSYNYESSKAEYNHVLLNKRSAQINVTVTPNFTKQNTKIVFNATIKDVTINGTNTSIINNNGKVIFKINGKVVKDEDGNIIFVKVVNNSANYTYYIPNGMASVYNNSVLRNYTVEAVYGNPLYDSDTRNTTIFNVEQSPININVANITINKNTNKLTLKANITDYQENLVVGTNKICLKINDKTLTDESNNTIYYYITDGIIDLSNITVPAINNYHNITIVAGERYAYKSNKITSTDINVVDK